MKRILSLLLFLITFSASAQFIPAQINWGNYDVYGSVWINKLLRLQAFKDTTKSDTLILVVNHTTGQVDTMNFTELASIIGGSTASKWAYNGTTLHPLDTSKNVAIGTNDAEGNLLRVDEGRVLFGKDTSGSGVKLMWIPEYRAFRVGEVTGTQWNNSNIGSASTSFNLDTKASGSFSFASGYTTTASSTASNASGERTIASGYASNANGYYTKADASYSFSANSQTTASSFASSAFGLKNINTGNDTIWIASDTLFQIGNDTSLLTYNDAFRLNKNASGWIKKDVNSNPLIRWDTDTNKITIRGELNINNLFSFPISDGLTGQTIITDGSGTLTWGSAGEPSYFDSTNTVIHLKDSTNNFSIGTKHLAGTEKFRVYNGAVLFDGTTGATPVSGAGTRLMWIPAKSALRAGTITDTRWNDANIGSNTISLGYNAYSTGTHDVSIGYNTYSSGTGSISMGYGSTCSGDYAIALGNSTVSSNSSSTAMGAQTIASGVGSTATGYTTTASGYFTLSANDNTTAQSYDCSVFGRYNKVEGTTSSWVNSDPLFQIGNGTGTGANSNDAFRLNKDGSGWVGDATPAGNPLISWNTTANTITIDSLVTKSGERALSDEASLAAPTSIIGGGTVYVCSATTVVAWAHFNYNSDGSVTLENNSTGNVVNTDTDGNFCIYDAGSGFAFKNRLGAKYQIKYTLIY